MFQLSVLLLIYLLFCLLSDSNPMKILFPAFLSYLSTSTDLPSTPGNPVAIRNTDTSVVVIWGASKEVKQLVGYYIECSEVGTDVWMPCNNKPVKQTRYAQYKPVTHSK